MMRRICAIGALMLAMGSGGNCATSGKRVIPVSAKRFEFSPKRILLKRGETAVLEVTSLDRRHGFSAPDLHLEATIDPGSTKRLTITATQSGTFEFHCDVFCGEGHEDMTGEIVVE